MKKPNLNLVGFTGLVNTANKTTPDAEIDIELIDIEKQVRTKLGDLSELATSIKDIGVLEPIILLDKGDGRYRLIAGERRLRASMLAGKAKIPALVRRDLDALTIRQIQVTENNDREALSAFDEAMGVSEDADLFGFDAACKIWNRSGPWVSKRQAVKKYAAPVLSLMHDDLCGDLEVLQSLNQLVGISTVEFNAFERTLRSGGTLSREQVRDKVSTVKTWQRNAQELKKRRVEASAAANDGRAGAVSGAEPGGAPKAKGKKPGKAKDDAFQPPVLTEEQIAAAAREQARIALDGQRQELMDWGSKNQQQFSEMQLRLGELGYDLPEGEWVLWTGFLDTVLPMLASLGTERGMAYVRRLGVELNNGADPLKWWRVLHPVVRGASEEDRKAEREKVPPMPDGWTF